MPSHFTPATLKFLRGLARNNDRDWFEPRRAIFEAELKAPMLALIEEVNHGLESFAPEHVRPPHKTMFRIYRDTRFAKDKRPYKSHIAAWWGRRGMEKTSGAGWYFHVSPKETLIAAGIFMPQPEQLLAIRRYLSEHHTEYRALLKKLTKPSGAKPAFTLSDPEALTRVPKGFPADHPAADLLRARNFGVRLSLPPEFALSPNLAKELIARFKQTLPLTQTINHADTDAVHLPISQPESARKRLF